MKRRIICTVAYFYGPYLVIKKAETDLWEAFTRDGRSQITSGYNTEEIDRELLSLTPDPYVQ